MNHNIRRDIEDTLTELAAQAGQNNDKPLQAAILVVRALSSRTDTNRDKSLVLAAKISSIFLEDNPLQRKDTTS